MKPLAVALVALAFPSAALAQEVRLVTLEVPLRGERTLAAARPPVFDLVGLHWQGPGEVRFRTRSKAGRWSGWRHAQPEPLDLPDAGVPEAQSARAWKLGNPHWVGASTAIQYRLRGRVTRLRAHFVSSPAVAVPVRATAAAGSPPVIPRSAWRADESIRRGGPVYAQALRFALVHHTAGTNDYTAAQSAAIVRAIQVYHVKGNGWNDVGYNFLVDKYGQVFEGRFGGVDRNVVGAHAEGFNTGSVGVALLGNYGTLQPTARAVDAIAALLAWRLDVAHVDPLTRLSWISGGNARFPSGAPVPLAAIAAHRDTGFTACPGNALYRQLPTITRKVAELGLPKLYEPIVQGRPGGHVRFTARLSAPLPWTVNVFDAAGAVVASGRGDGPNVDWTWDATFVATARFTYTIEAGPNVRPASGVVGQTPTTLTLSGVQASPRVFTPNGDSQADSTVVSYALSLPATVTATLRDPLGRTLATLFRENRKAGRHTFRFTAAGIPDGRYSIVIDARASNGREARSEVAVVVDRVLAAFTAVPPAFSPNGDRRLDQLALRFVLASPATVKLRVANGPTIYEGQLPAGRQEILWGERLKDGRYAAVVEATGVLGTRSQTTRFAVDTKKPRLRVLSKKAMRFWVSEPATVVARAGGRRVVVEVARAGRFVVPGRAAKRVTLTAFDLAGNRSAPLRY